MDDLRPEPEQRHRARAAKGGQVVLVGAGVQPVVLDQPVREARAAERVEARRQDGSDPLALDPQRIDGAHGAREQFLLHALGASLQVRLEERLVQDELATLNPGAGEDPLRELVVGEAEPVERLLLGLAPLRRVEDREAGEPRHLANERLGSAPWRDRLAALVRLGISEGMRHLEGDPAQGVLPAPTARACPSYR